jgi:hypothetical protein
VLLLARFRVLTAMFDAWLCRDTAFAVVTDASSSSSSRASSWFSVETGNTVAVVVGCVDAGVANGAIDCVIVVGMMGGVGVMIFIDGTEMTRPATCVVIPVAGCVEVGTGAVVGVTGSVKGGVGMTGVVGSVVGTGVLVVTEAVGSVVGTGVRTAAAS